MCGEVAEGRSFLEIDRGQVITHSHRLRLISPYFILNTVQVNEGILIRKVNNTTLCNLGGDYFSSDF